MPVLTRLTQMTKIKGAMAENGDNGDIAGMNCRIAVNRKYTFANLLN